MAAKAKKVMLAELWKEDIDPTGYWMSEKLDGVRAYWSGNHTFPIYPIGLIFSNNVYKGSKFYTRQGNPIAAPNWFVAALPSHPLDGELWYNYILLLLLYSPFIIFPRRLRCGRGQFQKCVSIVRTKNNVSDEDWKKMLYLVFDAPGNISFYF